MEPEIGDNLFSQATYDKDYELPSYMWGQLEKGHKVVIQRDEEPTVGGQVEIVAVDVSIFWVRLDYGRGRIAVYPDDSTRVWLPRRSIDRHLEQTIVQTTKFEEDA